MSFVKTTVGLVLVACCAPMLLAFEGVAGEPVSPLSITVEAGETMLSLDDDPAFHATINSVSDAQVVSVEGTLTRVVVWNETKQNGNVVPYYGVALDGRNFNRITSTSYQLKLRFSNFDPVIAVPEVPEHLRMDGDGQLYVVQFITQPLQVYRDTIDNLGGTTRRFIANHAHIVQMSSEVKEQVAALPFVRWVGAYHLA